MSPDYVASALCKFYCNGRFSLASVVFSPRDFFLVCFASLVEKRNHPACTLFRFGCLHFLACKARCEPNVFESGSVPFCVGPSGSLIDVATQAGPNAFIIASSILVPCGHDPAVHFCQLRVGDNPGWMFRRHAKCEQKLRVNLTIASHLEFVTVAYEQEPTDC